MVARPSGCAARLKAFPTFHLTDRAGDRYMKGSAPRPAPDQPSRGALAPVVALGEQRILRGILLVCLGVSLFPVMNAIAKYLGGIYPGGQVIWLRYLGHLLVVSLWFLPRYGVGILRSRSVTGQIARSFFLFGATACYFVALPALDLPIAAIIQFTAPLIVTALAMPLLGEVVGVRRWSAVIIGFFGTVLIVRPWRGMEGDIALWAVLLVLGSATSFALYQIMTRRLSVNDTPQTGIMFTAVVGTVVAAPLALVDFQWPVSLFDGLLFAAMGPIGGLGHYLLISGFAHGEATALSPFGYFQLVGSVILGYLIFGFFPDLWVWTGATIIIASGIYMTYREYRLRTLRATE